MLQTVTGDGEVVLIANPDYFKGRAHIDKFVARPFADQNIMAQALMFNAIDMIVLVNPRNLPEVQATSASCCNRYNALSYSFFGYNVRNPLLADRRVRQAITAAVNRQRCSTRSSTARAPSSPARSPRQLGVQPRRQALAVRPGAGARAARGGGLQARRRRDHGEGRQKLALSLKVPIEKESEAIKRVVLAFQNYLKNAGIAINVEFKSGRRGRRTSSSSTISTSCLRPGCSTTRRTSRRCSIRRDRRLEELRRLFQPEVDGLIVESSSRSTREAPDDHRSSLDPRRGAAYTFLWTLTNYSAVPQEGCGACRSTRTVLLVRRRVVHSRQRAEVNRTW